MVTENLQKEILRLKEEDKIKLVKLILESLDKTDIEIQNVWVKESENRYDAYKEGKAKLASYEEVMKRLER
ncbi:addiction module protein [bacterium]|nr:addiction module protein [bacterium]